MYVKTLHFLVVVVLIVVAVLFIVDAVLVFVAYLGLGKAGNSDPSTNWALVS